MASSKSDNAKLSAVADLATELFVEHALVGWVFAFDFAKTRAGLCDYRRLRITLSRHYALLHEVDASRQVLLHEIAHALVGKRAGHGETWRDQASSIGYLHQQIDGRALAETTAPWLGVCPSGHQHFRYRRPTRSTSCVACHPEYSIQHQINWTLRANPKTSNQP